MESRSSVAIAWGVWVVVAAVYDLGIRFLTGDTKPLYCSPALAIVIATPVLLGVLWAHHRWSESRLAAARSRWSPGPPG